MKTVQVHLIIWTTLMLHNQRTKKQSLTITVKRGEFPDERNSLYFNSHYNFITIF